jgi:hypothetical protein
MCSPASEFRRQPESGCATGKPNFETGRQRRILRGGRAEENDALTGRLVAPGKGGVPVRTVTGKSPPLGGPSPGAASTYTFTL